MFEVQTTLKKEKQKWKKAEDQTVIVIFKTNRVGRRGITYNTH